MEDALSLCARAITIVISVGVGFIKASQLGIGRTLRGWQRHHTWGVFFFSRFNRSAQLRVTPSVFCGVR